jgi:tetratricopeptide (TPR) repeat protein
LPSSITAYRILIELADELEEERKAFGSLVHEYNSLEAIPRDVLFVPVRWEPDIEPSQRLLQDDYRKIDYFVLVLWDRWPPGGEDEYQFAAKCLESADMPLSEVVLFFKEVPQRQLSDPGDEIQKVLTFRRQLEAERRIRFDTFSTIDDLKNRLRWNLSNWLIRHEQRRRPSRDAFAALAPDATREPEPPEDWQPHPLTDEPDAVITYGRFLQGQDMLDEAEAKYREALDLSKARGNAPTTAIAYGHLGVIYQRKKKLGKAEELFLEALAICEQLRRPAGLAACFSNLGVVYRKQDELEKAEEMFLSALRTETELDRPPGMAYCYRNLALLADFREQPEKAEQFRRAAQAVNEELEYPFGELFPSKI